MAASYSERLGSGEIIEFDKHIEECHDIFNVAGTLNQHVHHQLTNSTGHSTTCTVKVMWQSDDCHVMHYIMIVPHLRAWRGEGWTSLLADSAVLWAARLGWCLCRVFVAGRQRHEGTRTLHPRDDYERAPPGSTHKDPETWRKKEGRVITELQLYMKTTMNKIIHSLDK